MHKSCFEASLRVANRQQFMLAFRLQQCKACKLPSLAVLESLQTRQCHHDCAICRTLLGSRCARSDIVVRACFRFQCCEPCRRLSLTVHEEAFDSGLQSAERRIRYKKTLHSTNARNTAQHISTRHSTTRNNTILHSTTQNKDYNRVCL